ncbi:MAG: DUF2953 domain-containing protein [Peptococcaceae bacterium]|nr:DUF2953 domain-containing protein [Peptococcaceae bacterium]
MIQGLALLCAFIFWGGLAFVSRWTIRLHVTSKYPSTDSAPKTPKNGERGQGERGQGDIPKDLDATRVSLQCRGPGAKIPGTKAGVVFSFSAASLQDLLEIIQEIVAGRMSSKAEVSPKVSKENKGSPVSLGILLALRYKVKTLLHTLTRKTELQTLRVRIRGGTGDAALTALLHGALWMGWGSLMAHLHRRVKVTGQDIGLRVKPDFAWTGLDLDMISIVRLKTSHIIVKSVQLALWIRRSLQKSIQESR